MSLKPAFKIRTALNSINGGSPSNINSNFSYTQTGDPIKLSIQPNSSNPTIQPISVTFIPNSNIPNYKSYLPTNVLDITKYTIVSFEVTYVSNYEIVGGFFRTLNKSLNNGDLQIINYNGNGTGTLYNQADVEGSNSQHFIKY